MTEATKTLVHVLVLSQTEYLNVFLASLHAFILSKLQSVQSFAWPDFFFFLVLHNFPMKLCYLGHNFFSFFHIPLNILTQALFYLKTIFSYGLGRRLVYESREGLTPHDLCLYCILLQKNESFGDYMKNASMVMIEKFSTINFILVSIFLLQFFVYCS